MLKSCNVCELVSQQVRKFVFLYISPVKIGPFLSIVPKKYFFSFEKGGGAVMGMKESLLKSFQPRRGGLM